MREAFGMTNFPSFSQAQWKASRRHQEPKRLLPAGVWWDGAAPGVAQQNTERRKVLAPRHCYLFADELLK